MKLSRLGEFAAIERLMALCKKPGREVTVGIGDDAAAYGVKAGRKTLAACDMMVEGVHFDLSYCGFESLGYKALAVNLSDIAAMGGTPRYYLVSLAMGKGRSVTELEDLYRGMESAALPFGVRAIGGDTCSSPGPVAISVTILGEAVPGRILTRSGARPGDDIYVTGTLGDSARGLELLKSGGRGGAAGGASTSYLIHRHLAPTPRIKAGRLLAESRLATSAIDISDGLSSDLGHILKSSAVGAEILAGSLPLSSELLDSAGARAALKYALHGGEDYELLFTARPGMRAGMCGLAGKAGVSITLIGRVTEGGGAVLVSGGGERRALAPKGYDHFRKCS